MLVVTTSGHHLQRDAGRSLMIMLQRYPFLVKKCKEEVHAFTDSVVCNPKATRESALGSCEILNRMSSGTLDRIGRDNWHRSYWPYLEGSVLQRQFLFFLLSPDECSCMCAIWVLKTISMMNATEEMLFMSSKKLGDG